MITSAFASPQRIFALSLAFTGVLCAAGCGGGESNNATRAEKIVFVSREVGSTGISVINADGTGRTRLLGDSEEVYSEGAFFSPDGSKIYFRSSREDCGGAGCYDGSGSIPRQNPSPLQWWEMNRDGSGLVQRTRFTRESHFSPFSPSGARMAFAEFKDGTSFLKTANADGSGAVVLQQGERSYNDVSFSPDGSKIVYQKGDVRPYDSSVGQFTKNEDIYVMNADGTGETRLTKLLSNDFSPAFSPDGKQVVFQRDSLNQDPTTYGRYGIYIVNVDGSGERPLVEGFPISGSPSFSPDGKQVIFRRENYYTDQNPNYNSHLMIINADGTGLRPLTPLPLKQDGAFGDSVAPGAWTR